MQGRFCLRQIGDCSGDIWVTNSLSHLICDASSRVGLTIRAPMWCCSNLHEETNCHSWANSIVTCQWVSAACVSYKKCMLLSKNSDMRPNKLKRTVCPKKSTASMIFNFSNCCRYSLNPSFTRPWDYMILTVWMAFSPKVLMYKNSETVCIPRPKYCLYTYVFKYMKQ